MNIGFIGGGKLGQDCAEAIADKGHYVEGYDIEVRSPRNFTMKTSIAELVLNKDIIFISKLQSP